MDLEISENAVRKGWTMMEAFEIARRKERMAALRGKDNQEASQFGGSAKIGKAVDARKEAADFIGVSHGKYQQMKTIVENRDLISAEDFADWDEKKLSTNKTYQKVKAELERIKKEKEEAEFIANNVADLAKEYPGLEELINGEVPDTILSLFRVELCKLFCRKASILYCEMV